jgi:hypothetical protein
MSLEVVSHNTDPIGILCEEDAYILSVSCAKRVRLISRSGVLV